MEVFIVLLAFIIAMLFSMLGLGGAIIYTPLLFWLGLPLLAAIPMALLLNTITTASASLTYLKQHLVNTGIAFPIILTSSTGAIIGSYLAEKIDSRYLVFLLSIILLFASLRILFFNTMVSVKKMNKISASGAGFLIGVISALVGIGGGTFMVLLLLILGLGSKSATATSSFIITFMAFAGFMGHASFGYEHIDTSLMLYAGISAFIGAQTGSRIIFSHVSSKTISRMFALILLLVVGKLWYGLTV